jgi:hypothetical protein
MEDEGYSARLAQLKDPKTPRRVALGLLRHVRLMDLASLTRNKSLPTELRQAAEGLLKEKLPTLPLGIKVTLARLVSEELIKTLLAGGEPEVVRACFENPRMKEAVALWAVNHAAVPAGVIEYIAGDGKWSVRYPVRFALLRNANTPVARALELVEGMNALDLRFLYNDPSVPVSVKVQIEIELERKGQTLAPPSDAGRVIGIPEAEEPDDGEGNLD